MLSSIFKYELKYYLKSPATWFYILFFFGIAFLTMGGMAGESSDRWSGKILNSTSRIIGITKVLTIVFYFILPAVMGLSLFRDYSSRVHEVMYSFPIKKRDYLLGKFLSSFSIIVIILIALYLGLFTGTLMPWANPDLIGPFKLTAYLQPFLLLDFINLLVLSVIVFGVVAYSRNIYAGFVTVLLFILFDKVVGNVFGGMDAPILQALFDPFGGASIKYYALNWTVAEYNTNNIPMKLMVFLNRLFWLGIAALTFGITYRSFSLSKTGKTFSFRKKALSTSPKEVFGKITSINLPEVKFDYSFFQNLKTTWRLSNFDFRHILTSAPFIFLTISGLMTILFMVSNGMMRVDTQSYPLTRFMLDIPLMFLSGLINVVTFLYAGLLIDRARMNRMNQLVDSCPIPNWTLLFSKFLAIIKVQVLFLTLMMIGGMLFQLYKGYFNFEIDQYFFELFAVNLIHFIIWGTMAMFIQTLIPNPYVGFFVLVLLPATMMFMLDLAPKMGMDFLTQGMFRFNSGIGEGTGIDYSDMAKYGPILKPYYVYKAYWGLAGIVLLSSAFLLWTRGFTYSFKERLQVAKSRINPTVGTIFSLAFISFIGLGFTIFQKTNIEQTFFSDNDRRSAIAKAEKKYAFIKNMSHPKITDVNINMNLFPEEYRFEADGKYWVVNQSNEVLDTLILNYAHGFHRTYDLDQKFEIISQETIADVVTIDVLKLEKGLEIGDSLRMEFTAATPEQTWIHTNDVVKSNGSFIEDDNFPRFGNWFSFFRKSLRMGTNKIIPHPSDSLALVKNLNYNDEAPIMFETVVSTSANQRALAPGYLAKEWTEDGRNYFHYKMDKTIAHSYLFMSGEYEVSKDKYNDIDIEIYYHDDHAYNIDRMNEGLKDGLEYCEKNFTPYQFRQIRIIEFAQVGASSAHGFPNNLPFGEGAGFVADLENHGHDHNHDHGHDHHHGGIDYAYGTAVHEVAHQWWGNQVKPIESRGSKFIVESLAEYVNVMLKKEKKGIQEARNYLQEEQKRYFKGRRFESKEESPLVLTYPDQNYIHYPKGATVLYMMAHYIGEENLNKAIGDYAKEAAFLEDGYTTSLDLLEHIKKATPDSLQYLVKDWFETITLYDNRMLDFSSKELDNGQYQVDLEFIVSKYRIVGKGERVFEEDGQSLDYKNEKVSIQSLPMSDYVEVGIFGENGKELYLQKHKITDIHNKISITVDEKPIEAGVDPHLLLMDADVKDNRVE